MANTLTNLIPTLYEALDVVSRELVGAIPSVARDSSAERAAKDQSIRIPITNSVSASTAISPGLYAPDTGDQTVDNVELKITKAQAVPIRWNGEEQKGYASNGYLQNTMRDQFAQAMRTLVNEIESDVLTAACQGASRAYGTAATTPFATALDDAAQIKKILDDNGAPMEGRSLIIDTAAGVKLRTLTHLTQSNTAGSSDPLRRGVLLPIFDMDIRESAKVVYHTKGAGTGYDIVTAGEAIGQTTLSLEGGTVNTTGIKAGDIVTFSSDTLGQKYCVNTGLTATSGDIVIGGPGLLEALADAAEMTIGSSYRANVAFQRGAIQLVTRTPAMPIGGDMADDIMEIVDPVSGLAFQVAVYRQYRQVHYEIGIAWGVKAIKPAHIAILLG